ncbi:MAG: glycosyltransferase [Candidatus Velthaea sp.]
MSIQTSVVVPAYNAAEMLGECLSALQAQSLPRAEYEIIVVDDGSTDGTAAIAQRFDIRLVRQRNGGAAAARNTGAREAAGAWLAFIDADCVPSRGWLRALVSTVRGGEAGPPYLGAAGRVLGLRSAAAAARFVDISGALDTERHLSHPRYPFPPSGNVLYRRDAFLRVGGFDERFQTYEACDLHDRIRGDGGAFRFEPRAIVLHQHRKTWRAYFRQQFGYGVGYAQFMHSRRAELPWSVAHEVGAWWSVARAAANACRPGRDDAALFRRGTFVKQLAQRCGFVATYWRRRERARWSARPQTADAEG